MLDELPYDPADPPAEPPDGCADPLLWRVSHALRHAHRPRPDGFCECREFWPCPEAVLAERALHSAWERSIPRPRIRAINIGRWAS
jgi:hypothetical protein